MGILTITDTSFAGNLKNYYQRFREDLFPLITALFAQFQKFQKGGPRNMRWGGNGAIFNIVTGDPVQGTFSPGGYFPVATSRKSVQCTVGIARLYFRKQYDKLVEVGTNNKQSAFISIAQQIDEELRTEYKLSMQEALHGAGTGIKALISNVVSTTVVDITSPYGVANTGQGALWVPVGLNVAVLDATDSFATVLGRAAVTVVALQTSPDTYRVTFGTAVAGMAAGDALVGATASDTAFGGSPNGLINLTNRAAGYNTLHGQTPATAGLERWDSSRMVAGTDTPRIDQLLETDLVELMMRVRAKSGHDAMADASEFIIVTTPGLKKSYVESVQGQRELTLKDTSVKLAGGYATDATCNGVPILDDPYCPIGTVYLLHKPSLGWVDAKDFGAVSQDNDSPWRWVTDRDAYETNSSIFFNTATTKRSAHGSITGYTDGQRYSPLAV